MRIYAPWEKYFKKISTPFEHFLHAQTTTGIILLFTTILALILANSPLSESYQHLFHTNIDLSIGSWSITHSVHHWINDGLMTLFFFIIGLEIKREVLLGELSNIKVAALPIIAAIGGMVFPALIYYSINIGTPAATGWGIPMATDIAFAISALVLLKNKIPASLITFLVALAIVDDLGAVLVIALFYTEQIATLPLMLALSAFLLLVSFNRLGIHAITPYFIVSIFLWFFMLESGVHATIAGILAAMAIPSKPKITPCVFTEKANNLLIKYDDFPSCESHSLHENQKAILFDFQDKINKIIPPSTRLEHTLHLPISLIVIPLFALANAGIAFDFSSLHHTLMEPVSLGIIGGLVLGKVFGIFGVSWLAIKLKLATLPKGSNLSQIFGVSFLGGIGFTMSIFIADLAFINSPEFILQAKTGVLIASIFAGIFGYWWLKKSSK